MSETLTQKWLRDKSASYPAAQRVYVDIDAALRRFTTLRIKLDVYIYDDGRSHLLLCVHGLLPITYRNASYNIPIAVWITRDYPRQPPIVYVVPSADLLVRASRYVDVSGRCNLEYMQQWERKSEGCSLSALLEAMQEHFSREPPLFAKPKQSSVPPPYPSASANRPQSSSTQPSPAPSSAPTPPAIPPKPVPSTTSTHPSSFPPSRSSTRVEQSVVATPPPPPPPPPPVPPLPSHLHPSYPTITSSNLPNGQPHPRQYHAPSIPSFSAPSPPIAAPLPVHALAPNILPPNSTTQNTPPPPLPPPPSLPPAPPSSIPLIVQRPHAEPPPPNPPSSIPSIVPPPNLIDEEPTPSSSAPPGPSSAPPRPPNPETLRLHAQVHAKLKSELASLNHAMALDAERLRAQQADLLAGEPAIRDEMARLEAVRDVCRTVAERTRRTVEQAEANVTELRRKGEPEVDELVCAISIVHDQLINLVAEDNAIEDTIYHLHRALNYGRVDLEKFLRATRALAEEQFMKRALIDKIQMGLKSSHPTL